MDVLINLILGIFKKVEVIMTKLLKPISYERFRKLTNVRFNNINEGFDKYINGILEIDNESKIDAQGEERFINFIKRIYEENNKSVITDFYLKNIDEEGILIILEGLDREDKLVLLRQLRNENKETVYFEMKDEELMSLITKLSTRELLFCTMYFLEKPMTLWGNYNMKFPIFFESQEHIKFYEELAKSVGLKISHVNYKK